MMQKLYCDTCVQKSRGSKAETKCPMCDGYIRQYKIRKTQTPKRMIERQDVRWIKKGMIWVQKRS